MDHKIVQQILDKAGTRGTAIVSRTIKEMVKDKKTILVALVSLFPIILGFIWSYYLSSDEDISEIDIDQLSATGEVYCYVEVPEYLPNTGNYTFHGEVINQGDTIRQVAVNMTIGDVRKTTGFMNIIPMMNHPGAEPYEFSITYDMEHYEIGFNIIVIQLYVNNSVSSSYLIPDNFDWLNWINLNLSQFDPEEIYGSNSAVYSEVIEIKPIEIDYTKGPILEISKSADFMPLSFTYPSVITPDRDNLLNGSISSPVQGSSIFVQLLFLNSNPIISLATHSQTFSENMEFHNFTLQLPEGFSEYGFDQSFSVEYKIFYTGNKTYEREEGFTMDLVKEEYLSPPEYSEITLSNNTMYIARFDYPKLFVKNGYNTLQLHVTNNEHRDIRLTAHVAVEVHLHGPYGDEDLHVNYSTVLYLEAGSEIDLNLTIPYLLEEIFPEVSSGHHYIRLEFSIQEGQSSSEKGYSSSIRLTTIEAIAGKKIASLSDRFIPSLYSTISLPEDLSKTKDIHNITGIIQNQGGIEKEFRVKVTLQDHIYYSDYIVVQPGQTGEYFIHIPSKNHTKEFDARIEIEVYSIRSGLSPEARTTSIVNIISEGHKERKVIENFLGVYVHLYLKLIVPLVSMVYGISLISNESERKTLSLYLTTPITRTELILYKFGGYLVAVTIILTVPLILIYFSFAYILPFRVMIYYLLLLGVCIFDLFLAIAAYGAVFTAIGTFGKHPVLLGLIYLMVWEFFMGGWNIFLTQCTLFYHIKCAVFPFVKRFVPDALNSMGLKDISGKDFTIPMEVSMSVIIIVVFVFLFFAIHWLSSKDIN